MVNPGNRNTDQVHFGQVRTLTAEQFPHFAVTFRFLVAEGIDSFNVCHNLSLLIIIVFFPINVLFQSCFRRAAGEAFHWEGNGEKPSFPEGQRYDDFSDNQKTYLIYKNIGKYRPMPPV